ncbi:hypothetical protein CJF32_00009435 [Rutstroemia sp. NJR-2017a WRK4]|nr:hypothetical protein CJF32_00009435 [Rutstroemia sp. NJR-2017a WRK4]
MAPDLNSVPPSPRPPNAHLSRTPSERTSSQSILPPPLSSPSLNILPSNQSAVAAASPPLASPNMTATIQSGDNTGVGTGPGPLRHPRPLTAADLHLQLEKEQEAVVNRLTRELSMLRAAQNASVVSNASSTSNGLADNPDNTNHLLSGPSHPIPAQRRHHRTSSSTSTRSITATTGSMSTIGGIAAPRRTDSNPHSLSRQNSMTGGIHRSGTSSPAPTSGSFPHPDHFSHFYHQQRPSMSMHRESSGTIPTMASTSGEATTNVPATGRYEEMVFHRQELEAVKKENEALKKRIRDLEKTLRERRRSDASASAGLSRARSESVSTTASVGVGRGRDREKEGEDDGGVRVGRVRGVGG